MPFLFLTLISRRTTTSTPQSGSTLSAHPQRRRPTGYSLPHPGPRLGGRAAPHGHAAEPAELPGAAAQPRRHEPRRVPVPRAAGLRLPAPPPAPRLPRPAGRRRPDGQHHVRLRARHQDDRNRCFWNYCTSYYQYYWR